MTQPRFSSPQQEPWRRQGSWGLALKSSMLAGFALFVTSCAQAAPVPSPTNAPTAPSDTPLAVETAASTMPSEPAADPIAVDPSLINPRVTDFDYYSPPRLLGLDAIAPIYNPEFLPAAQAPLEPDELVIGIELEGQAKAYPISVLRFREMVNDELAGWPILVSW